MSSWLIIIAIIFIAYSCSKNKGKSTADRILEDGMKAMDKKEKAWDKEREKIIQKERREIARLAKTNPSAARRKQMELENLINGYNQYSRELDQAEEIARLRREINELKKWRR